MNTKEHFFSSLQMYFADLWRGVSHHLMVVYENLLYALGVGENRREITEQYPDPVSSRTETDLPARVRGLLFNDIEKCTGCGECVTVCPMSCIELEAEPGPDLDKKWVSVFSIDFGACVYCGFCVETCKPNSLIHTKKFELAHDDLKDLVLTFGRGKISGALRDKWLKLRTSDEEQRKFF